jgi:hypothetical protein
MDKLRALLSGKKAYIAAVGLAAAALISFADGTIDFGGLVNQLLAALAVAGVRAAVAKGK